MVSEGKLGKKTGEGFYDWNKEKEEAHRVAILINVLSTMSTPYNNEERRFALRMALRLPIVVSGRAEDGSAWSEPTETDDISTSGALFHLNQKVNRGERLYLRAHRPDGAPIEVTAVVIRTAPAIYGTARVGVQIAEPTESWLRLFVSWVADEQPASGDPEANDL